MNDDEIVMVVRHIVVKGPRKDVEAHLQRCWLQPGQKRETGTGRLHWLTQEEIHRAPFEVIDVEEVTVGIVGLTPDDEDPVDG